MWYPLPCKYFQWKNPKMSLPPVGSMEVDAIIHLMGEPLDKKRWTKQRKLEFRSSRIDSTKNIVKAIENSLGRVKLLITASAIGIYGNKGDKTLTENSKIGEGFLAKLCEEWEHEAKKSSCRNVQLRFGIVLDNNSRTLTKLLPIFENGLGGKISTGNQWMSWIHIDDLTDMFIHAIENSSMDGVYNAVS